MALVSGSGLARKAWCLVREGMCWKRLPRCSGAPCWSPHRDSRGTTLPQPQVRPHPGYPCTVCRVHSLCQRKKPQLGHLPLASGWRCQDAGAGLPVCPEKPRLAEAVSPVPKPWQGGLCGAPALCQVSRAEPRGGLSSPGGDRRVGPATLPDFRSCAQAWCLMLPVPAPGPLCHKPHE